jgi:phage baseplate assembly protein gpV
MSISDVLKRHAVGAVMQFGVCRFGLVESVDPNTYTAKVNLQPDGELTGWLPIASQWIGNGWGLVSPPNAGDQVILAPHEADADNLVIVGRVYSQSQMPPVAASGEFWLVHSTGSFIKLTNDGNIESQAPIWKHTGSLEVTGGITAGFGTSDSVTLQHHTHDQPNDSAGDGEAATNPPNPGT